MKKIINRIKEDSTDWIVDIFWTAIKAAEVTAIILLMTHIFPIKHEGHIRNNGTTTVFGVPSDIKIDQTSPWDVKIN